MKLCGYWENQLDVGAADDFCDYHCRRAAEVNDTLERNMDWFGVALWQFVIRKTWTVSEVEWRSVQKHEFVCCPEIAVEDLAAVYPLSGWP